ncbi:acyl-CoA synthetase [Actinocorallia populi]|uniref:acyl-CoA synthetase n=1 Tax=Actinocorallia populi TaxID=2079200 RepID=UPI000D096760|nr:acyl-CoA synthetase [Actinocorallia populi]
MTTLNLASLYEAVAAAVPQRTAVVCEGRRLTFQELDERASALGHGLLAAGIAPGDHVGLHLLNGVEYVEALLACLKIRTVPVNINYRYTDRELEYLYTNADLTGVVVDEAFAPSAARVADRCPKLRAAVVARTGDAAAEEPSWPSRVHAAEYEKTLAGRPTTPPLADERSSDDHYIVYTGGTTGLPKGVVWRHEDFYMAALKGGNHYGPPYLTAAELAAAAAASAEGMVYMLTAPLMHGAASYNLFTSLLGGAKIVILRRFDPLQALRLIDEEKIGIVMVVGDAMARPLADTLRAHRSEFDLSSWFVLGSGGAILSRSIQEEFKELLRPDLFVNNGFGASESGVDGTIQIGADGLMRLSPNPRVNVVDGDLKPIPPGSEEIGTIARSGHVPLGYYNDPDKTARTFPVIDGVRWSILGDMARVEEDGTVVVLGRGSGCINTGGEKVFPEEVEQALKSHPAVMDVLVAGVPDSRFGERVAAVVELRPDAPVPGADELREHCRAHLAGYKIPALITFSESIVRSPSGKADYRWAKQFLTSENDEKETPRA